MIQGVWGLCSLGCFQALGQEDMQKKMPDRVEAKKKAPVQGYIRVAALPLPNSPRWVPPNSCNKYFRLYIVITDMATRCQHEATLAARQGKLDARNF